jgi:hypothetical protein
VSGDFFALISEFTFNRDIQRVEPEPAELAFVGCIDRVISCSLPAAAAAAI